MEKDKSKVKKHIEELQEKIRFHNKMYYVENDPQISDFEYDIMLKELERLENQYPEYKSDNSPTQKVGGEPLDKFKTVQHKIPMMSLGNTYNQEDLMEFDKRVRKDVGDNVKYTVEPKIDGVSISIKFDNNTYKQAITRGDGKKGDDVTENIKTIRELPLKIYNEVNLNFEVRGEVYITISDFKNMNTDRENKGEKTFANPRNFTAGSLKNLNPKEVAQRKLRLFLYYLIEINEEIAIDLTTQKHRIKYIEKLGLPVIEHFKLCNNMKEVINYINDFEKIKDNLDYETDGMVIKVNSISMQEELGYTSKEPRWAISYKYPAKRATTRINDVIFQVGRLGSITPVAKVEPVSLSGTTVSSASLHNFDEIERKDVRVNDTVFIEKAGEIIPQVVQVIIEKRPSNTVKIKPPEKCPSCNTTLVKDEGEVAIRCPNYDCPEQVILRISHFASKNGMDIEGMGEKYVRIFYNNGIIKNISDIYKLEDKKEKIEKLEGFGKKSVNKLIKSIEKSKNQSLFVLLKALGIRHIGEKGARILSRKYDSLDKIMNATVDELSNIYDFGNKMAQSVYDYFHMENNLKFIQKLLESGINTKSDEKSTKSNKDVFNKKFVLTGTLPNLKRDEAKKLITEHGGEVTTSVSKKTDYLVAGDDPGRKYDKAKELNINIIDEKQLLEIINKI